MKIRVLTILSIALISVGCSTFNKTPVPVAIVPTVITGDLQVGTVNYGVMGHVQAELEQLNVTENAEKAISGYSRLLQDYYSTDGQFEQTLLVAICLKYLQQGYINEFLQTAETLDNQMATQRVLSRPVQYVLDIAYRMKNKEFNVSQRQIKPQDHQLMRRIF